MEQFEQAIQAWVNPTISGDIKLQAKQYLDEIKTSPQGWQLGLELFLRQPKSFPEARLFSLQILDYSFNYRYKELSLEQALLIKDNFWKYITSTYLNESEEEPIYMRTKMATTLSTIFRRLYLQHWRSFFDELINVLSHDSSTKATDFFLRVIKAIDEEVVNPTAIINKEEIALNTDLKDYMRERDITNLVAVWNKIIVGYQNSEVEFSAMALEIMGAFVDWIDIGLVVTEPFMNLLYQFIRSSKQTISSLTLRNTACDCFNSIISKGMKSKEKYQMLQMFNTVELISNLPLDDAEYVIHVARLTNKVGLEYFMIWKNSEQDSELQINAYNQLYQLMSLILKFMGNDDKEISITVFPIVNEMINLLKQQTSKMKRPLDESQNSLFSELLKTIISRLKYPEDFEWDEEDEEDEEDNFSTMRKSLNIFFDNMSFINKPLFDDLVHSVVTSIFATQNSNLEWTKIELALRILYQYGSTNNKSLVFLNDPNNLNSLNHLGDMVFKMVKSNVLNCSHPSLAPIFYENCVRYYQFFELRPDLIPDVLSCFLDQRGIYHESKFVRCRVWYLFLRFVKLLKEHTAKFIQEVVPSLEKVLVITAELPPNYKPDVPLTSQDISSTTFDAHLYLFEAVTTLLNYASTMPNDQKVEALKMVLTPLISGIQQGITQAKAGPINDPLAIIQLHHLIMAVGSVSKGLPDVPKKDHINFPWTDLLVQSTQIILTLLELTNQYKVIRDAARFTFSRLLTATGAPILPLLIDLIRGFVLACEPSEMLDFFQFMTLPLHMFESQIFPFVNEILGPLLNKAFTFLDYNPSGTDDYMLMLNLRKAYVSFLASLINANLDGVLCSGMNQNNLPNILMSLIMFCKDNSNAQVQKMSFNILSKMITSWLINDPLQNPYTRDTIAPQFKENFVEFTFQNIVPTSFEVPLLKSFDLTDGQFVLIFGEITVIHQLLLRATGTRFIDYLTNQFFPSINCPVQIQQEYLTVLQQGDAKAYRKYFQNFVSQAKSWN
ncbi:Xpo1-domain-containing protein [Neoconidiobolus thromboides FSU 785]|nr:Xpo1-domain-containing protein [Neoconidiobolus thromboides FSU 785]